MITTEQIRQLRDQSGVSIMQCKKALEESGGNFNKALDELRKKGAEIASKKSNRNLGSGIIHSYIHSNQSAGSLIELLCETDFVAKNDDFKKLAHDIAMHITAMNPEDNNKLLSQQFVKKPEITINQLIEESIQKFGERIELGNFIKYSLK